VTGNDRLADGLAGCLGATWDRQVKVSGLSTMTAGARRHNVVFVADDGAVGRRLVATIVPPGETEINPIDVEANVRSLAEAARVPVPHVHAVDPTGRWVGAPMMISEHVDGETVPRRVLRLIAEHDHGEVVARQLGEALARLHAIEPAAAPAGLQAVGDQPPAEAAIAALDEAMDMLLQARPAVALGLGWLERNLPLPPPRRAIVHGDVRNGNLIVGPDGLRAVLDWEGALAGGDPMQDVAWPALRMWRFREDHLEVGGFAKRAPYVAGYVAAGGAFDPDRYRWWKVQGTAKWALGLASQAMAFIDGRVPSIVMAASGRRVAELEWDLLMLIRR